MTSRFPVVAKFDNCSRFEKGAVLIDRAAGLFSVRPYRRRRTYTLPLSDVATMVCQAIIMAEVRERRAAKKAKRR